MKALHTTRGLARAGCNHLETAVINNPMFISVVRASAPALAKPPGRYVQASGNNKKGNEIKK